MVAQVYIIDARTYDKQGGKWKEIREKNE